jgi:hypothetical protein
MPTDPTPDPTPDPTTDPTPRYRIRVQGHVDARLATRLGLADPRTHDDATTTLTSQALDQAALHGLLRRIRDLGLSIVSIDRLDPTARTFEEDPR